MTCRQFESRDGYRIIRLRPLSSPLGNAMLPTIVLNLASRGDNYDLIHAHSHLSLSTNICAAFRRVHSPPLIITNHGLISQTAPMGLQNLYLPTVAKWTFRSADGIICYTENEKAEMVKMGVSDQKISVIHNGIDTRLFRPGPIDHQSKTLLWIGRYTPGKGVEYLIDAFALFKKDHADFSLMMIGRGPNKDAILERIRKLGLTDSVIIRDFVPNSELPEVYRNARAFVLPSLEEGVPRSILEAMACGVPVVCTNLPQLVSIVSGAGRLIPPRDSRSIADQLSQIIANEGLSLRLGKVGIERVRAHYSWDDTVRRTLELYEHVVGVRNGYQPQHHVEGYSLSDSADEIDPNVISSVNADNFESSP